MIAILGRNIFDVNSIGGHLTGKSRGEAVERECDGGEPECRLKQISHVGRLRISCGASMPRSAAPVVPRKEIRRAAARLMPSCVEARPKRRPCRVADVT